MQGQDFYSDYGLIDEGKVASQAAAELEWGLWETLSVAWVPREVATNFWKQEGWVALCPPAFQIDDSWPWDPE